MKIFKIKNKIDTFRDCDVIIPTDMSGCATIRYIHEMLLEKEYLAIYKDHIDWITKICNRNNRYSEYFHDLKPTRYPIHSGRNLVFCPVGPTEGRSILNLNVAIKKILEFTSFKYESKAKILIPRFYSNDHLWIKVVRFIECKYYPVKYEYPIVIYDNNENETSFTGSMNAIEEYIEENKYMRGVNGEIDYDILE